jgi:pimeloyl-ACP methyl ester carboxylesterase
MPEGNRDDLLARGFALVTYDTPAAEFVGGSAPTRGPSVGFGPLAAPAGLLGRAFFRMVIRHAEEVVPRVVDTLVGLPMIDASRIGIAGTSTQGFIALAAFATEPRLASAAVVSACPDYVAFLRDSTMGMAGERLALDHDYRRWLVAKSPGSHPVHVAHGPLLLIAGEHDRMTPPSCLSESSESMGGLRTAFAAAGRRNQLRIRILPRLGHGSTPRSNQMIASWWSRWLGPTGR